MMPPAAPSFDIAMTTIQQRREALAQADFNLFRIPSRLVALDLLTDSGTGVMTEAQVKAMKRADESYAGSASYERLVDACRRAFGIANVLPTYQGRVAERLLVEAVIGEPLVGGGGKGLIVPNNAHFDTTRHMIERSGAQALNLLRDGDSPHAIFSGDMDVRALEALLNQQADRVHFVMLTITCNSNGGQPVSLENLCAVRELCDAHGKMLILDACRFAENAWFVRESEARGQKSKISSHTLPTSDLCPLTSVSSIVRAMFDLCDGATISARKDCLCNAGGMLLLRDDELFRRACGLTVLTQGFDMSYGGLPGRDMEAIATGLHEAIDQQHLDARISQVQSFGNALAAGGVPIVRPVGGHAIFIDAQAFYSHRRNLNAPAQSLALALYEYAGIRSCAVGSTLRNSDGSPMQIVRLAIPRRRYTDHQLSAASDAIIRLRDRFADGAMEKPRPLLKSKLDDVKVEAA